jgi:hypothetical protein
VTEQRNPMHQYLATYYSGSQTGLVKQVVPKLPNSTPIQEKRRLLFVFALNAALARSGFPTLLRGFAFGDDVAEQFLATPDLHPFNVANMAFVLVSDLVKWAANLQTDKAAAVILGSWGRRKLDAATNELKRLEKSLNAWGVHGEDLQFLVTDDKRILLTQLTRLQFDERRHTSLEGAREKLRVIWAESRLVDPAAN